MVLTAAALHHNKRKTNYHIHLIFAERNYLDEPIEKVPQEICFMMKKVIMSVPREILDENGTIRKRCKVIKKAKSMKDRYLPLRINASNRKIF